MKEEIVRQYWTISEVEQMLRESQSCIRFWCKTFDVGLKRSQSNHYRFMLHEITKLMVIKFLVHIEKYTIEGAKSKLKLLRWPVQADRWEQEVRNQLGRIVQTKT